VILAAVSEGSAMVSADRLLTPADIAARLSMSRSFIYQEIKAGRLKSVYLGRMPRVTESALRDYLAAAEARRS
jgi:excisionase family DNA binding protein